MVARFWGKQCILISLKTEIARSVNGPKLQGSRTEDAMAEAVPGVGKFGDLMTADHKVLSDNCEFRINHRYAVLVQDLATQWIQVYPCKNKTSQETQRSLQKFLEPERKLKVIYTDNSLEFDKACEDLSWESLHVYTTPIGDQPRCQKSSAQQRKAPLLYCCNRVWMKIGGQILWNGALVRETLQIFYLMGRRPMKERRPMKDLLGNNLKDLLLHLVHWLSITL